MARNYPDNGYASVTQILGVLRKIGLERWFQWNDGKWCNEESRRGRQVGTEIHDAIEQYINTGTASIESEYADEINNALQSFMLFRKENSDIKLSLSEVSLTSEKYQFNGTIDAPNPPYLVDWKSGNAKEENAPKVYEEHIYQTSAYVYLWNENNPDKIINQSNIVTLAKDKVGYNLRVVDLEEINDCFNKVFLPALSIYNYQKKGK